jgi:hypothetical protein
MYLKSAQATTVLLAGIAILWPSQLSPWQFVLIVAYGIAVGWISYQDGLRRAKEHSAPPLPTEGSAKAGKSVHEGGVEEGE